MKERYAGAQCVMVTPFTEDYRLDEDGLRSNTRFLIKNAVHVLQPTGSTGEFSALSPEEHKKVIRIVVEEAGGKVPVVPGTAHSSTKLTIELSQYAEKVGADGVMIVPPYYQAPTLDGIYDHYKAVADAIRIGIVVYNFPGATNIEIGPELLEKLAEIPRIVGFKESSGDMVVALRVLARFRNRLTFTIGGELFAPYYYMSGARGHVTSIANFAPQFAVDMYEAARRKDWEKVREIHGKVVTYFDLHARFDQAKGGSRYVPIVKEAMKMLNLPGWPPRKPLLPLDDEEREELRKVLKEMGLFRD